MVVTRKKKPSSKVYAPTLTWIHAAPCSVHFTSSYHSATLCRIPIASHCNAKHFLSVGQTALKVSFHKVSGTNTNLPDKALPRQASMSVKLSSVRSQIPNVLTYVRVAAIPLLIIFGLTPPFYGQNTVLSSIFATAALTDLLDGYLARKWNSVTPMGTFLDPVADKLIVAVALVLITARFPTTLILLSSCATLTREIFVSALREWMAIRQKSAVVKVSNIGKVKTASQLLALSILLAVHHLYAWYTRLAIILLTFSTGLAIFSAFQYVQASVHALRDS